MFSPPIGYIATGNVHGSDLRTSGGGGRDMGSWLSGRQEEWRP